MAEEIEDFKIAIRAYLLGQHSALEHKRLEASRERFLIDSHIRAVEELYKEAGGGDLREWINAWPKIVVLCGGRACLYQQFMEATYRETMAGNLVICLYPYEAPDDEGLAPEQKRKLDLLRRRKIYFADEVLIISPNGFTDDFTRQNIDYATAKGIPLRWFP